MKKILFAVLLLMAPVLFLQSKAQAAEISLTAENKKSANDYLTQTQKRKTLKKNLICAILNTVAQAANFDAIGGNYYVQI